PRSAVSVLLVVAKNGRFTSIARVSWRLAVPLKEVYEFGFRERLRSASDCCEDDSCAPVIGRTPSATANFLALACLLLPGLAAAQTPQNTEAVAVLDANSATVATLLVPRSSIQNSEIGVLINDNDPQSVEVARYYQQVRNIPSRNMIHLNFDQNKI